MNIYLSIICLFLTLSLLFAMPFTSSDGFYVTQWRDILVFVLRLYAMYAFVSVLSLSLLIVVMYDKCID